MPEAKAAQLIGRGFRAIKRNVGGGPPPRTGSPSNVARVASARARKVFECGLKRRIRIIHGNDLRRNFLAVPGLRLNPGP